MPRLKRILIGKPLSSEDEHHQRLSKKIALPVFASDAISSTAYATDEIVAVLLLQAYVGTKSFGPVIPIAVIVCVLMAIVVSHLPQRRRASRQQDILDPGDRDRPHAEVIDAAGAAAVGAEMEPVAA